MQYNLITFCSKVDCFVQSRRRVVSTADKILRKVNIMLEIKKEYESVNKTFRIPVNIAEQLERLAGIYNTSVNKIVIQCLEYAIENIDISEN